MRAVFATILVALLAAPAAAADAPAPLMEQALAKASSVMPEAPPERSRWRDTTDVLIGVGVVTAALLIADAVSHDGTKDAHTRSILSFSGLSAAIVLAARIAD